MSSIENKLKHLKHPFYDEANEYREMVRNEQILKGAEKYPEPFNPFSWTPEQLIQHFMQENVDQSHYAFGLYQQIQKLTEDNIALIKWKTHILNNHNCQNNRKTFFEWDSQRDQEEPLIDKCTICGKELHQYR